MTTDNDNPLAAIANVEVFMPRHRVFLRRLVQMDGISPDEQDELYRLVLNPFADVNHLAALVSAHLRNGATLRYPDINKIPDRPSPHILGELAHSIAGLFRVDTHARETEEERKHQAALYWRRQHDDEGEGA